jgi:hypothetical protein
MLSSLLYLKFYLHQLVSSGYRSSDFLTKLNVLTLFVLLNSIKSIHDKNTLTLNTNHKGLKQWNELQIWLDMQ